MQQSDVSAITENRIASQGIMVKNFKREANLSEEGDSPTRNKGQIFRTHVPNLKMNQIDNSYGFNKTDRDISMPYLHNQQHMVS